MKYAIVYSSKTGNTAMLANAIALALPAENCVYAGTATQQIPDSDMIFAGFWTDKGTCDDAFANFLKGLQNKQIFLFGTAGFGGSEEYFAQILSRVKANVSESNMLVGNFMCQGKMPLGVRQRYEAMLPQDPVKMQQLIDNFDRALAHPNTADLQDLQQKVTQYC